MIRYIIIASLVLLLLAGRACAALLVNEIACGTTGGDWVELFLAGGAEESTDISGLYVTMYYGTNEPLSADPVTIYGIDRPETAYDDRFVVIHLTAPGIPDETDLTGDANGSGCIDVYCNNYSGSLWNSDCVAAIDTDDDPENGGITDFTAFSTRDGEANETITSYVEKAAAEGEWQQCLSVNIQECMIDIGKDGLSSFMTISRKTEPDTNSQGDFEITKFMTPGRQNIFSGSDAGNKKLFRTVKKKITVIPNHPVLGRGDIGIFVYNQCNIRLRIFSSIGMLIFESPLERDVNPGSHVLSWDLRGRGKKAATGLYIGYIEATSKTLRKTENEKIFIVFSRYK